MKVKKVEKKIVYVLPNWVGLNIRTREQILRLWPVPYKYTNDLKRFS